MKLKCISNLQLPVLIKSDSKRKITQNRLTFLCMNSLITYENL